MHFTSEFCDGIITPKRVELRYILNVNSHKYILRCSLPSSKWQFIFGKITNKMHNIVTYNFKITTLKLQNVSMLQELFS